MTSLDNELRQTESGIKNRGRSGTVVSSSTIVPPTPTLKSFGQSQTKSSLEGINKVSKDEVVQAQFKAPVSSLVPLPHTTYHFTNLDELELELDLYLPDLKPISNSSGVPVFFFVHSGGHITGGKLGHPLHEIKEALDRGWAVVSPNYPLSPQSTVAIQVEAVTRAWKWIVEEGKRREHFNTRGEVKLDTKKMMVAGGSAAASLLLYSLPKLDPKPMAQLLLYPFLTLMEKEGDVADLSDLGSLAPPAQEAASLDPENIKKLDQIIGGRVGGKKAESPMEDFFRLALHPYHLGMPFEPELDINTKFLFSAAVRPGVYRKAVLGFDYEDPAFQQQRNALDVFKIVKHVSFPPTIIIQGEMDSVTPIHLTEKLVSNLVLNGDRVEFIKLKDQHHVFDFLLPGKDDENGIWNASIGKGFDFLEKEVSANEKGKGKVLASNGDNVRASSAEKVGIKLNEGLGEEKGKNGFNSSGWMKSIGKAGTQFGKSMIKNAIEKRKSFNFGILKRKSNEKMLNQVEFEPTPPTVQTQVPFSPTASTRRPTITTDSKIEIPTKTSPQASTSTSNDLVQALRSNSTPTISSGSGKDVNRHSLILAASQTQSRRSSKRLSHCSNDSQLSLALSGSNASSRRNSALISAV